MLFGVFGPPCPMTRWGVHLVRTIVERALGPHDFAAPENPARLKELLAKRQHAHMVFLFEAPQPEITDMFLRAKAPAIVFAEDPLAMFALAAIEKKLPSHKAMRSVIRSFCALNEMFTNPNAYMLLRPTRATSLRYCIQYIAEFLQIRADERLIDEIVTSIAGSRLPAGEDLDVHQLVTEYTPAAKTLPAWFRGLPPEEQTILQDFRAQLWPALEGKSLDQFSWPPTIFLDTANVEKKMPHPIDLVGATRLIWHGPYLHLPRGKWIASFYFEAMNTGTPNSVRVDIAINQSHEIALGHSEIKRDGNFRLDLKFEIETALHSLEARFVLERGAIEGQVDLQKVEFARDAV